ncbi:MAG: DNA adenine methylase [Bacteroidales bacterium]|nr:DNA adenine methylase [Bacteroidales bacterium]
MVNYYGGKGNIPHKIFKNFKLQGIRNYVEPFSGMFRVYLDRRNDFSNVENIIYNDIYVPNCNIFQCAKMPYFFLKAIRYALHDEDGFLYYRKYKHYPDAYVKFEEIYQDYKHGRRTLPEVSLSERNFEAAVIYSFLRATAYNGFYFTDVSFRTGLFQDTWDLRFKILQTLWNNLSNIQKIEKVARISEITADDFEVVMERYNSEDTFIYIDAPYIDREHYYDFEGKGVFTEKDHARLAKAVHKSKAKIAISYYDSDVLHDYYPKPDFKWIEIPTRNNAKGEDAIEQLIIRY